MTVKKKRKKLLLSVISVILVTAMGAGLWLSNRSSEPVNVYSFQNIGMTEFWGDMQESYGPVTTDRIQTEFLSDTQTVTEVNVKEGDTVKKGDVLFSFDTTLDALSLERKRLEVDKIKVQIKAAEERLQETREMVPYEPPKETEPTQPDLGEELTDSYRISDRVGQDKEVYAGESPETAIICWLKEGTSITDDLLQTLWDTAKAYRKVTPQIPVTQQYVLPGESVSDSQEEATDPYHNISHNRNTPVFYRLNNETSVTDVLLPDSGSVLEEHQEGKAQIPQPQTKEDTIEFSDASKSEETGKKDETADRVEDTLIEDTELLPPDSTVQEEEQVYPVEAVFLCNGETVKRDTLEVGEDGYLIRDAYTHQGKTYWLESAVPGNEFARLDGLRIEPYPQEESEQEAWEARWKDGVEIRYIRDVTVTGSRLENNVLSPVDAEQAVELKIGKEAVFLFQSVMKNPPPGTKRTFSVTPADGLLEIAHNGDYILLSGKPEELTEAPIQYTVTANYNFDDNHGQNRAVEVSFSFNLSVFSVAREKMGECYVVFKSTQQNFHKGIPVIWQGAKVTAYTDKTFDMQLFDASGLADHTLPLEEELEIDLPQIDPNAMYTEKEILAMQKQCYATIKEQNQKLKMAESEYQIMQRELDDGKVYAEIDGKVFSVLTEEEARAQKQPLLKVSGGGGFYIEGSVSELEKDKLKLGQEVTVTDWSGGGTYTGEVISIGDFPTDNDSWNGMGNPNASYYPFKAFVGEEADLQAGSYVSITYSTASAEQGIYLEKAFVRSEKGRHWIYVRGADALLEKRDVRVGRVLWGNYYEILSPLSNEDYLAFPYGKHTKQGAPTVESDISALYGY